MESIITDYFEEIVKKINDGYPIDEIREEYTNDRIYNAIHDEPEVINVPRVKVMSAIETCWKLLSKTNNTGGNCLRKKPIIIIAICVAVVVIIVVIVIVVSKPNDIINTETSILS